MESVVQELRHSIRSLAARPLVDGTLIGQRLA